MSVRFAAVRNLLGVGLVTVGLAGSGGPAAGEPTAAGVSVAADAGLITVSVDAADEFLPEFFAAYWLVPSDQTEIGSVLSTPAGPGGITVNTVSSLTPDFSSIFFGAGETTASIVETFSAEPWFSFFPGFESRSGYFGLSTTPPGVDVVDPRTLWLVQSRETAPLGDPCGADPDPLVCCAVNFIGCLACAIGWGCDTCVFGGPEAAVAAPATPTGTGWAVPLRRYRDEILASTPQGQFYSDLYVQHSWDLMRAVLASRSLAVRIFLAKDDWVAGFQALVDGQGDQFVVSQEMQDDLLSLLDTFESVGSPALGAMISEERTRLQLDTIAGMSMTGYQQQIETLGGTSALEPTSWGRVKGRYRNVTPGR